MSKADGGKNVFEETFRRANGSRARAWQYAEAVVRQLGRIGVYGTNGEVGRDATRQVKEYATKMVALIFDSDPTTFLISRRRADF